MRAVVAREFGSADVLELQELPDLDPAPGEVLIEVNVAPVLRLDTLIRAGWQAERFGAVPPYVPGGAVVGTISAVGEGVDPSLVGTRVTGDRRGKHGGYAEQAVVVADAICPISSAVPCASAAAVQQDGRTALLLTKLLAPQPGEWVLVTAAAGGAGHLLVQLAAAAGAKVAAAAGADEKRALVETLGADVVLDYRDPTWTEELRSATGGDGPTAVFDGAGGELGAAAFAAMADGGRIATFGAPGGSFAAVDSDSAASRGITVHGLGSVKFEPGEATGLIARALAAIEDGTLTPHVGATFPLERAADAHRHIDSRSAVGKTILQVR